MVILLNLDGASDQWNLLHDRVRRVLPADAFDTVSSIGEFRHRLRWERYRIQAIIILIPDVDRLAALQAVRELILDIRLILILPPKLNDPAAKEAMLTLAHSFYPRFLTFTSRGDGDFSDVAAVLKRFPVIGGVQCTDTIS